GDLALQRPPGPVEPDYPGGGLRGQAGLGEQPALQVAGAPAHPPGQFPGLDPASASGQQPPGLGDVRGHLLVQVGAVEQDLVEQCEPGGPGAGLAEALVQFPGQGPEYLGAVYVDPGQVTC